jgi:hypothetical protein
MSPKSVASADATPTAANASLVPNDPSFTARPAHRTPTFAIARTASKPTDREMTYAIRFMPSGTLDGKARA